MSACHTSQINKLQPARASEMGVDDKGIWAMTTRCDEYDLNTDLYSTQHSEPVNVATGADHDNIDSVPHGARKKHPIRV